MPHEKAVPKSLQSIAPPPVQSPGQFVEFSPPAMSQTLSPHTAPAGGQSAGHVAFVSVGPWQLPLPHTGVLEPQSCVQLPTSEGAHVPSPQTMMPDGASIGGSSSDEPPSPQAQALRTTAQATASVDILIAAHRTKSRIEINEKVGSARCHPASAPYT
jgi:hypothetical protein